MFRRILISMIVCISIGGIAVAQPTGGSSKGDQSLAPAAASDTTGIYGVSFGFAFGLTEGKAKHGEWDLMSDYSGTDSGIYGVPVGLAMGQTEGKAKHGEWSLVPAAVID